MQAGEVVDEFNIPSVAGDLYEFRPEAESEFFTPPLMIFNECIPPGETRSLYGDNIRQADDFPGEVLPTFTSAVLRLDLDVLEDTAVTS